MRESKRDEKGKHRKEIRKKRSEGRDGGGGIGGGGEALKPHIPGRTVLLSGRHLIVGWRHCCWNSQRCMYFAVPCSVVVQHPSGKGCASVVRERMK